ncbi:MAG TPA: hypothetical protein DD732_09720 [Rhizobiales bacterium]|nr:hypothetical protein [Hyphomicrobiales bacterium]
MATRTRELVRLVGKSVWVLIIDFVLGLIALQQAIAGNKHGATVFAIGFVALLAFAALYVAYRALKERDEATEQRPRPQSRVGYVGRPASKGILRRAKFGKDLDVAIDNSGDVDAAEAEFSES